MHFTEEKQSAFIASRTSGCQKESPDSGWLRRSPIRFEGNDPNLRRYVGNGPTNLTDLTGLQGELPEPVNLSWAGGTEVNLEKSTFDYAGGSGTVRAVKDTKITSDYVSGKEKGFSRPKAIVFDFSIKGATASAAPAQGVRWIQFVSAYALDKAGKEIIVAGQDGGGRWHAYNKSASPVCDAPKYDSVYFDEAHCYGRTKTSVSIWDVPKVHEKELERKGAVKAAKVFDTYLILDGKVRYKIHWERHFDFAKQEYTYENIKGEQVSQFSHPGGKDDELLMGFDSGEGALKPKPDTDKILRPNPISPAERKTWK